MTETTLRGGPDRADSHENSPSGSNSRDVVAWILVVTAVVGAVFAVLGPLDWRPFERDAVGIEATVSNEEVAEGDVDEPGKNSSMGFVIELSKVADSDISFDYNTEGGSAKPNVDYSGVNGTSGGPVVIPAGRKSSTIRVYVRGDTEQERDEQFSLHVSEPEDVTLVDGIGTGTIRNDD